MILIHIKIIHMRFFHHNNYHTNMSRSVEMSVDNGHSDNPFSGPLSQEMWERAHRVPSAYEDTFDYGMYDRLYARFGADQPRGGVVYKGTMKLLEAQDCIRCFHRFEIDTYGRGCIHNCAYCYAKSYLSIRRYWNSILKFF